MPARGGKVKSRVQGGSGGGSGAGRGGGGVGRGRGGYGCGGVRDADREAVAAVAAATTTATTTGLPWIRKPPVLTGLSPDEVKAVKARADDWKWPIRHLTWGLMEREDIALFPRPVHHRIPNHVNADAACARVLALPEVAGAPLLKVNPDTPQKQARLLALAAGKRLIVPEPRLRNGFFSTLDPRGMDAKERKFATTQEGVRTLGKTVSFDDLAGERVACVIIGSVVACPRTGVRIGKGEGFAELEYGVLREIGCVTDDTLVVTTVHDCQLAAEPLPPSPYAPGSSLLPGDVPVDIICTPTQTIRIPRTRQPPKPLGIYWDALSAQKLQQVPQLAALKKRKEALLGAPLPTGPDEALPPSAKRT